MTGSPPHLRWAALSRRALPMLFVVVNLLLLAVDGRLLLSAWQRFLSRLTIGHSNKVCVTFVST
jgi:hypothetical protein